MKFDIQEWRRKKREYHLHACKSSAQVKEGVPRQCDSTHEFTVISLGRFHDQWIAHVHLQTRLCIGAIYSCTNVYMQVCDISWAK